MAGMAGAINRYHGGFSGFDDTLYGKVLLTRHHGSRAGERPVGVLPGQEHQGAYLRPAHAFAKLTLTQDDPIYGSTPHRVARAMSRHPELVSGQGRNDLALMTAGRGDWVVLGLDERGGGRVVFADQPRPLRVEQGRVGDPDRRRSKKRRRRNAPKSWCR